jgi:3-hydroxy-9,10-secoandrosta-1,3,5(10)-triene-9,17-dione monooxygenase
MTAQMLGNLALAAADREQLHGSVMAGIDQLLPDLAAAYAGREEMIEMPPALIDALDRLGAFRLQTPKRVGGLCASAETLTEAAIRVSRANPIAGWQIIVMNSASWVASLSPGRVQKVVFANGVPRMCASTNGSGTIRRQEDGSHVVNGAWHYASGSHYSAWATFPCVGEDGVVYNVAVPMDRLRIEPTWQVAGMRGTGSDTLVAENVVVGPDQICSMAELWGGAASPERQASAELADRWQLWPLMRAKLLGVCVGAAQGLLDRVIAAKDKAIMYTSHARRADSSMFQASVGRAASKIETARMLIMDSIRQIDNAAVEGRTMSYAECARLRGLIGVVIELLQPSVDDLMNQLGSSALADSNVAQRFWRDFGSGIRHAIFHGDSSYEITGRQLLGVEPNLVPPEMT